MPFLPAGDDACDHDVDVVALHRVAAATRPSLLLVQRTRRTERLPVAVDVHFDAHVFGYRPKIHKEAENKK
jgi:hypothetical protein